MAIVFVVDCCHGAVRDTKRLLSWVVYQWSRERYRGGTSAVCDVHSVVRYSHVCMDILAVGDLSRVLVGCIDSIGVCVFC